MSEGTRYHSTIEEWENLINAPKEEEDDLDVYAKKKMDHNSMSNMYKEIPNEALDTFKFGSVHYLLRATNNQLDLEAHLIAQVR